MPTFYVSTTGNDTTGNGSLETPYATIGKAITVAANNDIIEIIGNINIEESLVLSNSKSVLLVASNNSSKILKVNYV